MNFQTLKIGFALIVVVTTSLLFYNFYQDYTFNNNPLSNKIKNQIQHKKLQIMHKIRSYYGFDLNVPIVISDEISSHVYGLAVYTQDKKIYIVLNRKRFKENLRYMTDDVLPHEYAHAIMFKMGHFLQHKDGHSKQWQMACEKIGGLRCRQFVNRHDVIMEKLNIW